MELGATVLSGFALAALAPWIYRLGRRATGWLLALLPLALLAYFIKQAGVVVEGYVLYESHEWVPSLGIHFSFLVDGLGLLFALLITGIGALVLIYSGGYLAGHPQLGRFYLYILAFMASMLGVVTAGNLITLFVFWELTSISSYFLIGFDHERAEARRAALQALLVTGVGGLAMLAGFILLGQAGGSLELSALLSHGDSVRQHPLYLAMLLLILTGAFTKSAQVPFPFWLPNAMEAPTPVSTYLHSATMVKAGIYLLARLGPVLGGTGAWHHTVTLTGAATMGAGAYLALHQTDLKRILAYSTVSALGTFTLLLGLGGELAIEAVTVYLLCHAMYKGALFLITGAVDHESGTRDVEKLGGLKRAMPVTAAAGALAMFSMVGLPPFFGFIAKEAVYEAVLGAVAPWKILLAVAFFAKVWSVAAAGLVGFQPFFGRSGSTPKTPHEAPLNMWLGPVTLGLAGLILGLFPDRTVQSLLAAATTAAMARPVMMKLSLWHGLTPILTLSVATLMAGVVLFVRRRAVLDIMARYDSSVRWGPARIYEWSLVGLNKVAFWQTRFLQSGYLRAYLLIVIATTVVLTSRALLRQSELSMEQFRDIYLYEGLLAGIILAAAFLTIRAQSRLAAVVALGTVGYGLALVYVLYGAPDLAMTQFAVETLMVILFVFVLYRLPRFTRLSSTRARVRDAVVALAAGGMMTLLVLATTAVPLRSRLTPFFAENSVSLAHGRNIVNVILVDFRALDTLGEITVLTVAAIGVYALLKLRLEVGKDE